MKPVLVDTAGIVALLDVADRRRPEAVRFWEDSVGRPFVTTNYVLVETAAVLQRRLGLAALRTFRDAIAPVIDVLWVSPAEHQFGLDAAILAGHRHLSVVDCVSFVVMRERRIETAFTFDDDFRDQGFTVVPEP